MNYNTTAQQQNVPSTSSGVEDGMHHISSKLDALEKQVTELTCRLQTVVRPTPPAPTSIKGNEASSVSRSTLVERMHQSAHHVERISEEIESLLHNLEV